MAFETGGWLIGDETELDEVAADEVHVTATANDAPAAQVVAA